MFQIVSLSGASRRMLDASGKGIALLYQTFLMVGGGWDQMRWFLSRVTALCTDMGVEKGIVDPPDMLFFFY